MDLFNIKKEDFIFSAYDIEFSEKVLRKNILKWVDVTKERLSPIIDIQIFRNNSLISYNHLKSAIWHAWMAFKGGYPISNNLSIEFMLYASGQRQISKTIKYFGIEESENRVSLVIFHSEEIYFSELQKNILNKFKGATISDISFTNPKEKLNSLCLFFDYGLKLENDANSDNLIQIENFILTCVSNLVFER